MTEPVIHPHDEAERPRCAACETPLHGMFCHECGQHHGGERGLEFLTRDVLAEALSLEGKTATTVRDVFRRPSGLLNAWRLGDGEYYFSPFKLFLVISATFFVFVAWVNVPIYQYIPHRTGGPVSVTLIPNGVETRGVSYEDTYLQPTVKRPQIAELERGFETALQHADAKQRQAINLYRAYNGSYQAMNDMWNTWLPRLLWLLAPVYAVLLYVFFHHRRFAEHLLFTIWAHCVIFMILMGIALINLTGIGLPSRLLFPVYLGFFTVAAAGFYKIPRWQAFLRGLGHTALYALFVWFPILIGFSITFAGSRLDLWQYIIGYEVVGPGHEKLVIIPDPLKDDPQPTPVAPSAAVSSGGGKR